MKAKVLQQDFAKALSVASRFASPKAQLPVLGNIYLKAEKGKIHVAATNLEVSIILKVGADVKEEGELTVPAKVITELLSNLSGGSVELSAEKERLSIKAANFSSVVSGMNTSDFPKIPDRLSGKIFKLSSSDVDNSLLKTLFSASVDETRPVLTGILILFEQKGITFVATDGFRLSRKTLRSKKPYPGVDKMIIPKNSLSELLRLISDRDEISFSYSEKEGQIVFGIDDIVFSSRLIEGEFPNFEKIIPKNYDTQVTTDKEEFLRAIKLSGVFARESSNTIKLRVSDELVEVSSESSQFGEQSAQIDAKIEITSGTKDFVIAFNYKFVEDFLNSVEGDEIKVEFSGINAPGVFTDPTDKDFLHLIMPVKIS
jgi:DNA polymerase III subunit beta